jgi:Holliday junction resolvasome RuvABC endonuclease subunit
MIKVVGIDPSLHGFCIVWYESPNSLKDLYTKPNKISHKFLDINNFDNKWDFYLEVSSSIGKAVKNADRVCIEHYAIAAKSRSLIQLGELGGVCRLAIAQNTDSNNIHEIDPQDLKFCITGNRNATKSSMQLAVNQYYKVDHPTALKKVDDFYDAFSLAKLAEFISLFKKIDVCPNTNVYTYISRKLDKNML